MKYKKKPVIIEAIQWFKNGDHPLDGNEIFTDGIFKGEKLEGKIVRYFRHPSIEGTEKCAICQNQMHDHGFIDTLEGGHRVCPSDYIITGVKGEHYPCKVDIFNMTYEAV